MDGSLGSPPRPLPHFTSPPSRRPLRAPLPPTQQPLAHSSRPARKESLRMQGRDSEGIAMDGRGAFLEAALENRARNGVQVGSARALRERQAPGEARGDDEKRREQGQRPAQALVGVVGNWEGGSSGGSSLASLSRDEDGPEEVLREAESSLDADDVALSAAPVDLSRMTSTRRYMNELDPDDDVDIPGQDRSTWHSAWGSEARDSVASLEPLQRSVSGRRRGRAGLPRDSTLTTASVDGDPFSYSVYASMPSPRDSTFPSHAPLVPSTSTAPPPFSRTPIVRIGPPSPTTEAFLQDPHDSTLWSSDVALSAEPASIPPPELSPPISSSSSDQTVTPSNAPSPPSLAQSQGRTRSQTFSSGPKNFSRPFLPPSPTHSPLRPTADLAPIVPSARRPSSPRTDTADTSLSSPLDRSSSLGHASLLDRSSSMGHSSATSHSTHALAWDDGARTRMQEEAKRAIALARSRSQRAVAGREYGSHDRDADGSFEELQSVEDVQEVLSPYGGEVDDSPSSIHFPPPSSAPSLPPPAPATAYSVSEYGDTAQYAVYHPEDEPLPHDSPAALSAPFRPASPTTPAPFYLAPSSPVASTSTLSLPHHQPPFDLPIPQLHVPPAPASPRQRNVLRKPRPPPSAASDSASQPMARSHSGASSTKSEPAHPPKGGIWSRFRSRSKSRGASERPDPALWAQERPPMPISHGSAITVTGLSSSLPAPSPRFGAYSPSPSSISPSPASTPGLRSRSPLPSGTAVPLSQAEFSRLAASRPAFGRHGTSEVDLILRNVQGAKTVQAGTSSLAASGPARAVVVHRGGYEHGGEGANDDEVEQLSEGVARAALGQSHERGLSSAPSLYSNYSFYSLPSAGTDSPASPVPPPSASSAALAPPDPAPPTQSQHARQPSNMSTMQKLGFASRRDGTASSLMARTPSGKEVRRDPVTPDDYLQLGIDLHEAGELERAAWCFEQSARRNGGCGAGMLMYGLTLRHGWGCQVNAPLGFRYLQMAAESVVEDLDRVVFGGRTLSEAEANTKAAKSELVLALHEIGASYRFGWGVDKSKPMAFSYFKLAADLGDVDAQQDLAFCFANGKGCKKDVKQAAHYYRLAIEQGASDFGLSWVFKEKYLS
ncbi:hypothetical protein Rhopal_005453-T1 [Rhodotorula paludigena]|uniref:HCP-like protein n=1 Tax=Rhodotorula paludigena TaxID=86838 RepID=A0AAV5GV08_9BASI|nr:hypothetical protein Rhopal_005453-T1 [Rhodotorula paludigena]